jgi:hypothetical protein
MHFHGGVNSMGKRGQRNQRKLVPMKNNDTTVLLFYVHVYICLTLQTSSSTYICDIDFQGVWVEKTDIMSYLFDESTVTRYPPLLMQIV